NLGRGNRPTGVRAGDCEHAAVGEARRRMRIARVIQRPCRGEQRLRGRETRRAQRARKHRRQGETQEASSVPIHNSRSLFVASKFVQRRRLLFLPLSAPRNSKASAELECQENGRNLRETAMRATDRHTRTNENRQMTKT